MLKKFFLLLIDFYQKYLSFDRGALMILAPGGSCRYSPTCSEYTKQMIIEKGVIKGLGLGFRRILSCR